MGYRSLRECLVDLQASGQLRRIDAPIDPHLEMAEIQRRVYQAGGPALWFTNVVGCRFSMCGNLFGTIERTRYLFRDTLETVHRLFELKVDPGAVAKAPWRYLGVPWGAVHTLPRRVRSGPVMAGTATLDDLPKLKCWPRDGGAFITLPQVYTEDPDRPGWRYSNLGMYRVQLTGNQFTPPRIGLHYQIHRGIGVHHAAALRRGDPLRVSVFVGGPPAMTLAAVMPLPEGLPELAFAGLLGGRRFRWIRRRNGAVVAADADFVLTGVIDDKTLPEGPFGDHLGYYSLTHDFPVMKVESVHARADAIWPFTVVGRPPQEDTAFGAFIHELTGPIIPTVVHGVRAVHAVDAAGVHPLLLAIGSERYVPYAPQRTPQELLTCANAILGQGQLSLAKYLLIVAGEDDPGLDIHDIRGFFAHLLRRVDWRRDLHFQTRTTIDTLDYSGDGLNEGSKVIIAAAGPPRRELGTELPGDLSMPPGFTAPRICLPGIMAVTAPPYSGTGNVEDPAIAAFVDAFAPGGVLDPFPLIVLTDDSPFCAATLNNFLWTTFTRSNPAADIHGIAPFVDRKHWGCEGSLVIDARAKSWHADPLLEDPQVSRRVDELAAPGGPLAGLF